MTKSKVICEGCRNDYYNRDGGCWHFGRATVVTRTQVGTWQNPPYKWLPRKTLCCHTAPDGRHWIKRDDPRVKLEAEGE